MFSEMFKEVPRGVKIVVGPTVAFALFLFLRGHLYYFRNPVYLGGLIVIEVVLTSLWHFETIFFPLLMLTFLWAGMDLPWIGVPATARWFILGVAAVAGFVISMRERRHTYRAFHLLAFLHLCGIGLGHCLRGTADGTAQSRELSSAFLIWSHRSATSDAG